MFPDRNIYIYAKLDSQSVNKCVYLIKLQGFSRTTIAISYNRFKNTLTICERPSLYCFSYSPQLFVCLFVSFNRTRRKVIRTAFIIMQKYKQINVQINFDHVVQYSYSLNIQNNVCPALSATARMR